MNHRMQKAFFLFFFLFLCLPFAAPAYAGAAISAEGSGNVIAAFEPLGDAGAIETEFKLALVTLKKRFPERLAVRLQGEETGRLVPVGWTCVENYDEELAVYHFTPVPEGYTLGEGTEVPVLSVRVLGKSVTPPLRAAGTRRGGGIPISDLKSRATSGLARYDSFAAGRLPPIRNQRPYGSCWAFSVIGAMEADLIADGADRNSVDLSELHLAYFAYNSCFDEKGCSAGDSYRYIKQSWPLLDQGGTQGLAAHVLADMVGAASEASVPYSWGESYAPGPFEGRAFKDARLLNCYELNPKDRDGIKSAILQRGGVSASVFWDNPFYSYTYNSLYCPGDHFCNHAIMLVGWDDNFPASSFALDKPSGNGAWLVRNSWGLDDYGREGYFWLSYYDPSFLDEIVYVIDAGEGQYDHCYSYAMDPHALVYFEQYYDFSGSVTAEQRFMVDGGEEISAVGFDIMSSDARVGISLSLGDRTVETSAAVGSPGLYTVPLPTPLTVAQRSEVRLTLTFTGSKIRLPAEYVSSGEIGVVYSTTACGSGGLLLNGKMPGDKAEDGYIRLYTMDCEASGDGVRIDADNFPDAAFRNYVSSSFDADRNGYLSDAEIAAVKVVNFIPASSSAPVPAGAAGPDSPTGPVRSLKGLKWFTGLEELSCSGNRLEEIDVSANTQLRRLSCAGNRLTSLDLSSNRVLKILACEDNALTELDVSECPELAALISGGATPGLSKTTIAFSGDGLSLSYDVHVRLKPSFHLGTGVPIDPDAFPDPAFRNYAAEYCDMDHDGTLAEYEISRVKWIDCSGSEDAPGTIASLQGAEHFAALEELYCGWNALTVLDVSSNSGLKILRCRNNAIGALDLQNNSALLVLDCRNNALEELDLQGHDNLEDLDCRENPDLSALNLGGCSRLRALACGGAKLSRLALGDCSLLEELSCYSNPDLTSLEIGGCTELGTLSCGNTRLPALDMNKHAAIQKLDCSSIPTLASLNVGSCPKLTELLCNDCPLLESLKISGCGALKNVECHNCRLRALDLSGCSKVSVLTCYGNLIAVLDITPCNSMFLTPILHSPIIENGTVSFPFGGNRLVFDEGIVMIDADGAKPYHVKPDFTVPRALQSIGKEAFAGCPALRYLVIPEKKARIDEGAFGEMDKPVLFGTPGGAVESFARDHGFVFVPIERLPGP